MRKIGFACVTLFLIMGCADSRTVRPVNADRVFKGIPAKNLLVILPDAYAYAIKSSSDKSRRSTVSSSSNESQSYIFPPGNYQSFLEDEKGLFFKAPEKIIAPKATGGSMLLDGGVFIDQMTSKAFPWIYIDYSGATIVLPEELPKDNYRLESRK